MYLGTMYILAKYIVWKTQDLKDFQCKSWEFVTTVLWQCTYDNVLMTMYLWQCTYDNVLVTMYLGTMYLHNVLMTMYLATMYLDNVLSDHVHTKYIVVKSGGFCVWQPWSLCAVSGSCHNCEVLSATNGPFEPAKGGNFPTTRVYCEYKLKSWFGYGRVTICFKNASVLTLRYLAVSKSCACNTIYLTTAKVILNLVTRVQ